MTYEEERIAWDRYVSALLPTMSADAAAARADMTLEERRLRFPREPKPAAKPPIPVAPPISQR
jgi:hypothetical protein